MEYVFAAPPQASIAVANEAARVPVRRIFCVGRNYAAHAREMGMDDRDPPFFFTKPADAVVDDKQTIPYPPDTDDLNHEAELVAVIGKGGTNIAIEDSLGHVWGYAVGNDLTRRDIQIRARDQGRPWDLGKGFDRSAVIGPVHRVSEVGHPSEGSIRLAVNGEIRQDGNLNEMIWKLPEMITILSRSVELKPGDLIMTGTPAGIGPLVPGDICVITIAGLGDLTTTIGPRT
jgi:fumarylpyruvate hydrolase